MQKFHTDDIIGCGLNFFKREIFFTYNGNYYGKIFKYKKKWIKFNENISGPAFKEVEIKEFYATIGLHSPSEGVSFNFGSKPFKFDLK